MMSWVHINTGLHAALQDACVALGGHPLQQLLKRIHDESVEINESDINVIRDYLSRIEEHLAHKYPGHDAEEPGYQEQHEDLYLEEMALYRDKLVFMVADAVGDDFLQTNPEG